MSFKSGFESRERVAI